MEWKSLSAEIKRLDDQGRGEARIATLQVRDADGDVLVPGLLGGVEQVVPLVPAHRWEDAPLGKAAVREQGRELIAGFQLNMKLSRARAWYEALKFDLETPPPRQEWSFAFRVPEGGAERGTFEGQPVRFLKRLKLLEVSPVLVGASVATATLSLKADQDLAARTAEVIKGYYRLLERAVKAPLALPAPGSIGYTILNHADANHMYGRNVAVALVKEACDELKIQMAAAVELIREARESETSDFYSEKGIGGCTFVAERKIYLRYDLLGGDLAECAGHEAYHLTHRGGSEEEATRFGRAFAAKALGHAPRQPSSLTWEQASAMATGLRNLGMSPSEIARIF